MDEIPTGALVSFDANALIYYLEPHDHFFPVVQPFFRQIVSGHLQAATSYLTLLEVLVGPLRQNERTLADRYRSFLTARDGVRLLPIDRLISERAAEIRAQHGLRTPDSIVAATALEANCTHLVTNDTAFRRVENLNVLVVSDYA